MAEPGITKTSIMGLNMPEKGYFDWDVPMNENWHILDSLGAGKLPFMTPLVMEHKLAGDDAVGWALQGSELDGDTYVTAWEKLTEAQSRASTVVLSYNDITYNTQKDEVTGWVFVDKATYDKAKVNLKHSLGFVCDYVNGAKRIILPYKECYWKIGSDVNNFAQASLPNLKGQFGVYGGKASGLSGVFYPTGSWGSAPHWDSGSSAYFGFDASRASEVYKDDATTINPDYSTVYLYYRVADSAVSQDMIDLGNLTSDLATMKSTIDALERRIVELENVEETE